MRRLLRRQVDGLLELLLEELELRPLVGLVVVDAELLRRRAQHAARLGQRVVVGEVFLLVPVPARPPAAPSSSSSSSSCARSKTFVPVHSVVSETN